MSLHNVKSFLDFDNEMSIHSVKNFCNIYFDCKDFSLKMKIPYLFHLHEFMVDFFSNDNCDSLIITIHLHTWILKVKLNSIVSIQLLRPLLMVNYFIHLTCIDYFDMYTLPLINLFFIYIWLSIYLVYIRIKYIKSQCIKKIKFIYNSYRRMQFLFVCFDIQLFLFFWNYYLVLF